MHFGSIPTTEAEGCILAHSLRFENGTFKKGRKLSAPDIAMLIDAGVATVLAARFEEEDVPEDEAAQVIAGAICGGGAKISAPFTGRCNLYAVADGVILVNRGLVDRLNRVHESVTIATLTPFEHVTAGQLLATVKIIPFAATQDTVDTCVAMANEADPVALARIKPRKPGLVMTTLSGTKDSVLEKTAAVVGARIAQLGSTLSGERRCAHNETAIGVAVKDLIAEGCAPILICGASAIVDRRDVVPSGIVAAGGTISHFGMPVDPGNLILTANIGETSVIGLPGCARSPKLNGVDWVLWRLFSDVPVDSAAIQAMGVGGLLKETPSRGQLREPAASPYAPRVPRITAVILAAGQSRRMGSTNKLLEEVDGVAMVRQVVRQSIASQADNVIVVLGHESNAVRAALENTRVTFVDSPNFADGLSASLKAGIAAVPNGSDGAVVMLGDMPAVTAVHIDQVISAFNPIEGRSICVPTTRGKRGNPLLWGRAYFAEIAELAGDVGAKHLIGAYANEVCEVALEDDAIFVDVDTPEALRAYRNKESL